jgi:hypothetical protein
LELRLEGEKRNFEFYTGETKERISCPTFSINEVVIEDEKLKLE